MSKTARTVIVEEIAQGYEDAFRAQFRTGLWRPIAASVIAVFSSVASVFVAPHHGTTDALTVVGSVLITAVIWWMHYAYAELTGVDRQYSITFSHLMDLVGEEEDDLDIPEFMDEDADELGDTEK